MDEKRDEKSLSEKIDTWFTYHSPGTEDLVHYANLREAAKKFALVVLEHTPRCADQSAALRMIREAVMTANAAVACKGI